MSQLPDLPAFSDLYSEKERVAWLNAWTQAHGAIPSVVCTDNRKGNAAVDLTPAQRGRFLRTAWMNSYDGPLQYSLGVVYDTRETAAAMLAKSGRTDAHTVRVLIHEDTEVA